MTWHSCSVVVSGAGSGMCNLTNQRRLGIQMGRLKEAVAETEYFRQKVNKDLQHWIECENGCVFSIKACEPIPKSNLKIRL